MTNNDQLSPNNQITELTFSFAVGRRTKSEKRSRDDEHRITIIEQRLPNNQISELTFSLNDHRITITK